MKGEDSELVSSEQSANSDKTQNFQHLEFSLFSRAQETKNSGAGRSYAVLDAHALH